MINKEAKIIYEKLNQIGEVQIYDDFDWVSAVLSDLDDSDEVSLILKTKDTSNWFISLVWGNSPSEAMSDYSDKPELNRVSEQVWSEMNPVYYT